MPHLPPLWNESTIRRFRELLGVNEEVLLKCLQKRPALGKHSANRNTGKIKPPPATPTCQTGGPVCWRQWWAVSTQVSRAWPLPWGCSPSGGPVHSHTPCLGMLTDQHASVGLATGEQGTELRVFKITKLKCRLPLCQSIFSSEKAMVKRLGFWA